MSAASVLVAGTKVANAEADKAQTDDTVSMYLKTKCDVTAKEQAAHYRKRERRAKGQRTTQFATNRIR